jgi:DNA-binding MarR family transcriptional regulator
VLARSIGRFWRALVREGMLSMVRTLGDFDFSMPQVVMLMLLQEQGEPTIKQVAHTLGRSVSATGRTLDQLVRRGLVSRREDERDRRVKRVAITPEGRAFLAAIERHRADSQLAVMRYLSPEERAEVMRAMGLLAEAGMRRRRDVDRGERDAERSPD